MYLYVATDLLSDADSDECEQAAHDSLIQDLAGYGETASASYIDIGRGASADAFKVFLDWLPALSPIALYFLGSSIEKNFDAWISIAKRLQTLLRKLRVLGHHPIVTFEGACAIALDEIVANRWHEPGFEIDEIVLSNEYAAMHMSFSSMEEVKEYIEQQREDDFDPLASELTYTFFGRCDAQLFLVSVTGTGLVTLSKQFG